MTDRPSLILLPGQLCDEALWDSQVRGLADIADVIVADLTRDDSVGAMAQQVLAAVPSRFAVCGLSLGGYVAFEIVRRAPERVTHLGLMNTSSRADEVYQSERRQQRVAAARIGTFKGVTPHFLPSIVAPANAANPAIADVVLAMTERVGRVAFERQQAAAIGRADYRELLPSIACPTLVIGGREDRVTPPALQEEIAAGISGARLMMLEDCGHLAPLEQADTVTQAMRGWLSL
jgi:pimeloyl-ACP methyl ester carboxylesterase